MMHRGSIHHMPISLFTFDHPAQANWTVVNDGVMGGRSAGFVDVKDGTLRFTGTLVTQGGGFTLVRVPYTALRSTIFGREVKAPPIDLARIQSVGFYMADKQDGAFWLEVDYLRAVASAS